MILPQQSLNPQIKPRWRGSLGIVESAVAYNCRIHGFPVPVLAMPFWEGAGNKAYDLSGKMNHGALTNGPKWVGNAVSFDGVDDYVNAPASDTPFLGAITISVCAKITEGNDYRHFAGKHSGNGSANNPFDFRTDSGATPLLWLIRAHASGNRQWLGPASTLNQTKNYVVVCNDNLIQTAPTFYIDGIPTVGTSAGAETGAVTGSSAPIRVGMRADDAVKMKGQINNVLIFDRALTAAQVKFLHDNPYFMFQPIPVPYGYAVAIGGLSIPVAMHHYQHNIRI